MNRSASKSWLDAKILWQLIAKTSADSLSENDLIRRPPKSTKSKSISWRRLQGDSSYYIRHVVGKLKHLRRLKYKLPDVSAGKLSTPETWARDTGIRVADETVNTDPTDNDDRHKTENPRLLYRNARNIYWHFLTDQNFASITIYTMWNCQSHSVGTYW